MIRACGSLLRHSESQVGALNHVEVYCAIERFTQSHYDIISLFRLFQKQTNELWQFGLAKVGYAVIRTAISEVNHCAAMTPTPKH